MKHRFVIHAGMPKTGTTSIQRALAGLGSRDVAYAEWGDTSNHSPAYLTAFTPRAFSKGQDRGRGRSRAEIEALRDGYRRKLDALLESATSHTLIFSAEAFSAANDAESLAAFRDVLAPFAETFQVMAYVRPLDSAMASLFQQRCTSSLRKIQFPPPVKYRAGLEPLFEVFGDAVQLALYDPAEFEDGDVLADFCARIGIDRVRSGERHHTAVSAEASAILYFHGMYQKERAPHPKMPQAQSLLFRRLGDIGSTKLRVSPRAVRKYVRRYGDEIEWVNARIGRDIAEITVARPDGVGGIDDLRALAEVSEPALADIAAGYAKSLKLKAPDVAGRLDAAAAMPDLERRVAAYADVIKDLSLQWLDKKKARRALLRQSAKA